MFKFNSSPPKMPHGKKYDPLERECIAKAFAIATSDKVKGKDRTSDDFYQHMYDEVKKMTPKPPPEGKYSNRTPKQLSDFWRDKVMPDINRFIFSLRQAHASITTGNLGDDQYESIAVALHLGQSNGVALYNKRDFNRDQWNNYKAYKAVQHLDKFRWDFDGGDRRASTDSSYHSTDSDLSSDDGGGKPSASEHASAAAGTAHKRRAGTDLSSNANAGSTHKRSPGTKTTKKGRHVRQEDKRSRRGAGWGRDKSRKEKEKEERMKKRRDERNELLNNAEGLLVEQKRHNDIKERAVKLDALKLSLAIARDQGDDKRAARFSEEIERIALEPIGGAAANSSNTEKVPGEIFVEGESNDDGPEAAVEVGSESGDYEKKPSAQSVESMAASDSGSGMEMKNCDTDEDKYNPDLGGYYANYAKEHLKI